MSADGPVDPLILDSADYGTNWCVHAYWTNVPIPEKLAEFVSKLVSGFGPMDPSLCLDLGRTVHPYGIVVDGKVTTRTIGGSWCGDPDSPVADTSLPVLVEDVQFEKAQHLRPHETEQLLGWPYGIIAGRDVTAKDRLASLGDGWDLRTLGMINRFSKLARVWLDAQPFVPAQGAPVLLSSSQSEAEAALCSEVRSLCTLQSAGGKDALIGVLAELPSEGQMKLLSLIAPTSVVHYKCWQRPGFRI